MGKTALAVLAALAASAASASTVTIPECRAGWQDRYAADWDYPKESWDASCAAGKDPMDGLNAAQAAFIRDCAAKFSDADAEKVLGAGTAKAVCAQGKTGRVRLEISTGRVPKPAAPPAAAPAGVGFDAGHDDMGPLGTALLGARRGWHDDACLSGMAYTFRVSAYADLQPLNEAQRAGRKYDYMRTALEQYTYYFASASGTASHRISYGDKIDTALCVDVRRSLGPEEDSTPKAPGFDQCLSGAATGLRKALAAVVNPGSAAVDVSAFFARFPRGYFSSPDCRARDPRKKEIVSCKDLPGFGPSLAKAAANGAPMWAVAFSGRTYFVDATTGLAVGWAPGELDPGLRQSIIYGVPCGAQP